VIRLRRAAGPIPLVRYYEVELTPPDAAERWHPGKPVPAFILKRRLFAEGFYQRDVSDLVLEADEAWRRGEREEWMEHSDVRPSR
jgi:hypothetical protein